MTSIIRVGQSKFAAVPIDEDSQERIMNCITTLANLDTSGHTKVHEEEAVDEIFLKDTKAAYAKMVATEEKKAAEKKEKENKTSAVQVDDLLTFRQFSKKNAADGIDVRFFRSNFALPSLTCLYFQYEQDVTRATGSNEVQEDLVSNLSRVVQLTGETTHVANTSCVKD